MGASCSTNADAPTKQRAAPAFISNLVAVELLAGPTTSSTSSSSAEDETAPTCDSSCCKRLWVRISHTCRAGSNFVCHSWSGELCMDHPPRNSLRTEEWAFLSALPFPRMVISDLLRNLTSSLYIKTTKRNPIECAQESNSGGREWVDFLYVAGGVCVCV